MADRYDRTLVAEIKAPELVDNRLRGAAAVMGNMDRVGDVIFPGAFRKVIKGFLTAGFVTDSHEWEWESVVAMPVSMAEQGSSLVTECEFHGDADSQSLRQKCIERLQRGLSVGLSIGFSCWEGSAWFDTGPALLKYAESIGADMSLFDASGIKKHDRPCRAITEVEELYEYSIVPVPANPRAVAMQAKTAAQVTTERDFEAFLRDAGFSRRLATAITLHGYTAAHQRDAEVGEPSPPEPETPALKAEDLMARALRLRASLIGA